MHPYTAAVSIYRWRDCPTGPNDLLQNKEATMRKKYEFMPYLQKLITIQTVVKCGALTGVEVPHDSVRIALNANSSEMWRTKRS